MDTQEFRKAERRVDITVGESVRTPRELQELSQNQLAGKTGITQSTLPAIGNGRVRLGVARAKSLARASMCHPAVFVFPGWEIIVAKLPDKSLQPTCPAARRLRIPGSRCEHTMMQTPYLRHAAGVRQWGVKRHEC